MDWGKWILEKLVDSIYEFIKKRIDKAAVSGEEETKKETNHIKDVIQNEGDLLLNESEIRDFNTKSVLIVMPGEEAVFVNNGRITGLLQEGRHILDTSNYPFLSDVMSHISGGKRFYSSRIYFIKKTVSPPIDWGTGLQMRDPVQQIATRVMCHGTYRIRIDDSNRFMRYFAGCGIKKLSSLDFADLLEGEIRQTIKSMVGSYIMKTQQEILGINSKQESLAQSIAQEIKNKFIEYGIEIVSFTITGLEVLEEEPNRIEIERAYKERRVQKIGRTGKDH